MCIQYYYPTVSIVNFVNLTYLNKTKVGKTRGVVRDECVEHFDWSNKQPVNQVPFNWTNNNLFKSCHVVRLPQFLQTC